MNWIILSPHLDDAVLSLGGWIWEQTQTGEQVGIWTICAGDPPQGPLSDFAQALHTRWAVGPNAIQVRRAEDRAACQILGAAYRHFDVPDCIYRQSPQTGSHLYTSEEALWVAVHPDENNLIHELAANLKISIPPQTQILCPLTIGNHIDHRLTRLAAENSGLNLQYYAEYPYAQNANIAPFTQTMRARRMAISAQGLQAWQEAVAAHRSQISTFWGGLDEMMAAIRAFSTQMQGVQIWAENQNASSNQILAFV